MLGPERLLPEPREPLEVQGGLPLLATEQDGDGAVVHGSQRVRVVRPMRLLQGFRRLLEALRSCRVPAQGHQRAAQVEHGGRRVLMRRAQHLRADE